MREDEMAALGDPYRFHIDGCLMKKTMGKESRL
jgi:hypothetical protein